MALVLPTTVPGRDTRCADTSLRLRGRGKCPDTPRSSQCLPGFRAGPFSAQVGYCVCLKRWPWVVVTPREASLYLAEELQTEIMTALPKTPGLPPEKPNTIPRLQRARQDAFPAASFPKQRRVQGHTVLPKGNARPSQRGSRRNPQALTQTGCAPTCSSPPSVSVRPSAQFLNPRPCRGRAPGTPDGARARSRADCHPETEACLFWVRRSPASLSRDVPKENVGRNSLLLCKRIITVWEEGIHSEQVATGTEGRGAPGEKRKGDGFRAQCRAGNSRVLPPAWASCAHKHGGHVTRDASSLCPRGCPAGQARTPRRKIHDPQHLLGVSNGASSPVLGSRLLTPADRPKDKRVFCGR